MNNDSKDDQLEGVPPKLYKLALGASAGALTMVLVVMGGIVWRLNSDCPAVQRDIVNLREHVSENSELIDELQRALPAISPQEWREIRERLVRLEKGAEIDDDKVRQLEADLRLIRPLKAIP